VGIWEKTLWFIAMSYCYCTSTIKWLFFLGSGQVYKGPHNYSFVNIFFIDVCPAFLALAADIKRAFEVEEPSEDFDSILKRI
jgi:hypothetical protein